MSKEVRTFNGKKFHFLDTASSPMHAMDKIREFKRDKYKYFRVIALKTSNAIYGRK